MANPPLPQSMESLLGPSNGVGVQGVMPETRRNRAAPDRASRTGAPWPTTDSGVYTVGQSYVLSEMTGTMDPVSLPRPGIWFVEFAAGAAGTASADNRFVFRMNLTGTGVSGVHGPATTSRLESGDPFVFGGRALWLVTATSAQDITPSVIRPTESDEGSASINAVLIADL